MQGFEHIITEFGLVHALMLTTTHTYKAKPAQSAMKMNQSPRGPRLMTPYTTPRQNWAPESQFTLQAMAHEKNNPETPTVVQRFSLHAPVAFLQKTNFTTNENSRTHILKLWI